MSVKIRISYNTDEELAGVIRLLSPWVKSWKKSGTRKGKYRNAYVEFVDTVTHACGNLTKPNMKT